MINNAINSTYSFINKIFKIIKSHPLAKKKMIVVKESLATLGGVIPNSFLWFYKHKLTNAIACTRLEHPHHRPGFLYRHRTEQKDHHAPVLLLLHGYRSHPSTLLHLAEAAAEVHSGEIFSLQLPYNDINPETHNFLFTKAIDEIVTILSSRKKPFKGMLATGHSRGAIEFCYQAFIAGEQRIKGIISIAGRLRVVESHDKQCLEALKPYIHRIYQGILEQPQIPLYQIVAEKDWNAPLEETQVRKLTSYIVSDALHLNVLFHEKTLRKFKEFLKILSSP